MSTALGRLHEHVPGPRGQWVTCPHSRRHCWAQLGLCGHVSWNLFPQFWWGQHSRVQGPQGLGPEQWTQAGSREPRTPAQAQACVLQRERGPVARSGQPAAEARPAAESGQQGGGKVAPSPLPTVPEVARSDQVTKSSLPTAHPVPDLTGAVQPDPGGEEKDVRAGALHLAPRPGPPGLGRLLTPPLPRSPLMLNDSSSAHSMPKFGRQYSLEHVPGAGPYAVSAGGLAGARWDGCWPGHGGQATACLCLQAPAPAYSSSSLYSTDTSSGPIISDITELTPCSPLGSASASADERWAQGGGGLPLMGLALCPGPPRAGRQGICSDHPRLLC